MVFERSAERPSLQNTALQWPFESQFDPRNRVQSLVVQL